MSSRKHWRPTEMRIDTWGQFLNNTFGLMLFVKILPFLLMVAIGITAITLIHRRMQKETKAPWETQTPLTVRPGEFKPFPAETDWKVERKKMKKVCLQCHSQTWADEHFSNLDRVIMNYNENYFKPIKKLVDSLCEGGLLSKQHYFDEDLEWEFYELWHYEGRRARMGAAMMAPDYA